MSLLSFLLGREEEDGAASPRSGCRSSSPTSAAAAAAARPDYLPALQRELVEVISKYAKVPTGDVQVQLQRRHDNKQVLEVKVRLPQAATR